MPEQSIRDIIYQVGYGEKIPVIAISDIKEILKGKVTEILDTTMTEEYGMFRVEFVEEIVDKIMGEIK